MTIQKYERRQSLALRGGTDVSVDSQVLQELRYLCRSELSWMLSVMKVDEAADPVHVRLLGAWASVSNAQGSTDFIEQFGCPRILGHLAGIGCLARELPIVSNSAARESREASGLAG
jgi:hypothetical protein